MLLRVLKAMAFSPLPPVLRDLQRCQAERVLCLWLIQRADDHRQQAALAQVALYLRVQPVAPRRTVVAIPVGLEAERSPM
jgi:hypothetical protein